MLWQFHVNHGGTQPHMYMYPFSPKLPSHPGWHITLSRAPCAICGKTCWLSVLNVAVVFPSLPTSSVVKNLSAVQESWVMGSVPGTGRFPGEGNGNPLPYCCLENPMDRGAGWAAVHGVPKESDTTEWLNNNNRSTPDSLTIPLTCPRKHMICLLLCLTHFAQDDKSLGPSMLLQMALLHILFDGWVI